MGDAVSTAQMDLFPSPPRGRPMSSVLTRVKGRAPTNEGSGATVGLGLGTAAAAGAVPLPVLQAAKSLALIQTAAKATLNDADEVEVFSEEEDVTSVATILHFANAFQAHGLQAQAQPASTAAQVPQPQDEQDADDLMDVSTVADGPDDRDAGSDDETVENGPMYVTTNSATPQALAYLRSHQPTRHSCLMYDGQEFFTWRKAPQRAAIAFGSLAVQKALGDEGCRRVLRLVFKVLHSPTAGEGKEHLQAFKVQSLPDTHAANSDGNNQGLFATCDMIRGALPAGVTKSYVRVLPFFGKIITEAQWKASSAQAQRYVWWPGGLVPAVFNKLYVISEGQLCCGAYVNAVRLGGSVVHGSAANCEVFSVLCSAPDCVGCQTPLWHFHLLYGVYKSVEVGEELLVATYGDDYPG